MAIKLNTAVRTTITSIALVAPISISLYTKCNSYTARMDSYNTKIEAHEKGSNYFVVACDKNDISTGTMHVDAVAITAEYAELHPELNFPIANNVNVDEFFTKD